MFKIVHSLAYRTICIVLHSWQNSLNKQCIIFSLIIAFLFFTYMFIYDILHPYNLVRPNTPGAYVPRIMV